MNDGGRYAKLELVSTEKDLGVWITSKPNFTLHCDKASAKALRLIKGFLPTLLRNHF